jgi:hypothetical protein
MYWASDGSPLFDILGTRYGPPAPVPSEETTWIAFRKKI